LGIKPAVDDYMAANPNVKVEYYYLPPGTGGDEWLQARMMARDCPDIYNNHMDGMQKHIGKGWALPLDDWVELPNPYIEGNQRWVDTFEPAGEQTQIGPDGRRYGFCFDGAGVMIVYNKDAFADAGISEVPKTWGEFETAWQKLKDKGYIPFGGDLGGQCCYPHWSHGVLFEQLAWDDAPRFDTNNDTFIQGRELVEHTQRGEWPLWEAELGIMKFVRRQAPFLPLGYEAEVDYRTMFRQGKVVMYLEGNWQTVPFIKDPPPFELDWTMYPVITKDLWPNAPEKTVRLQGPWGSMNWFIPGYLPETDPDKIPVIMDLLMFISQPKYVSMVCAEHGTIPLIKGSTTTPEMEPFLRPYDRAVSYQSWAILSGTAYEAQRNLMVEYMSTPMSDDAWISKAKAAWEEEVRKMLELNPDWKIE